MPKNHRPDTREHWSPGYKSTDGTLPDVAVWPFSKLSPPFFKGSTNVTSVNQEDLSNERTLLVLLNSRGHKTPWEFAAVEMEFSPLLTAMFDGCANPDLCSSLTITSSEAVDPQVYGRLNRSNKFKAKRHTTHDKYSICARRAFQIMLMQQRILEFSVACATAILSGKTQTEIFESPRQQAPPISEVNIPKRKQHTTFTEVLNMAPYRGCDSLNFSQLRAYFEWTWSKHKNDIWAMREDPGYFADTVRENFDHNSVYVPSDCRCHLFCTESQPKFMSVVISQILSESYSVVNGFGFLVEGLDEFDRLVQQGATKQQQALPILKIEQMVRPLCCSLLKEIDHSSRGAPEFRNLFQKECATDTYRRVQGVTPEQKELLDIFGHL